MSSSSTLKILAVVLLTTASACASATLDVMSPVPTALKTVSLEIRDATRGDMSPEQIETFKEAVSAGLRDAGIAVVPASEKTPLVIGKVTEYDPGIRALRFIQRYGFGTGTLDTTWTVADSTQARCRIEGSVSMGTFGGSFYDVQEETGKVLARFLRGGIW